MYENHHEALLPRLQFVRRVLRHFLLSAVGISVALGIGVIGYHSLAGLSWIDALLNASMILGGMGPMDPLRTPAAKLFASAYALFSGLIFIGMAGLLLAPFAHRLMHHLHIADE